MSRRNLVLVGAGHAHLETMTAIDKLAEDGIQVTVISPAPYQYYSGMGPGLLSGAYTPQDARFDVRRMVESRGGVFIMDYATGIHPGERHIELKQGEPVGYDVVSFGIGSEIGIEGLNFNGQCMTTVKPIEGLYTARCEIRRRLESSPAEISVIGGGAAGVEMAANAARLGDDLVHKPRVTLVSRGEILRAFPPRVRRRCLRMLTNSGVWVLENRAVTGTGENTVILEGGDTVPFHYALIATGTRPPAIFQDSGVPTGETGGLLVDELLRCPGYDDMFGGGDCIDFSLKRLAKVGVYAVRQNAVLHHNLRATLLGEPLTSFKPQARYHLALNMGGGTGVSYRYPFMVSGKIAFAVKNRIDRKFMDRFI